MTISFRHPPDADSPFGSRRPGALPLLAWRLATHRRLARTLRKRLRKAIARRWPGPFDVEAERVKLRAYPAENHCDRTAVGRGVLPEAPERALIAPLLGPGMVFVDVGANVGVYSLYVSARTGGRARVVCFEPHPRSFAKLTFNCAANGFSNIECVNAAVGPEEGVAELISDGGGNVGGASLRDGAVTANRKDRVRVVSLAASLEQRGIKQVDLLKIDVEGYEDDALLPFLRTAPRRLWPRHILIETVHGALWRESVTGFLEGHGYEKAGATAENLLYALRTAG